MPRVKIAEPQVGEEEAEAVRRVILSRQLSHGAVVEEFEERFAEYIGVDYAIATSNGTSALFLMLKAAGIGEGDEVITTPFTFIATSNAVLYTGARPVFVDIEQDTYNIDPEKVLEAITPKTKAILAVHLYGHPADMKALQEIAEDHHLLLLEDAAQAHGAEAYGRKAGSLGYAAAFSFYATKNMTTGEGGMITTNERKLAERAKLLRLHGQAGKYNHVEIGYNFLMTNIQAAMGLVQLSKLDKMNDARRRNARVMTGILSGVEGVTPPIERPWAKHVYNQYVVRISSVIGRDRVKERLEEMGIETAIHYPRALPDQPIYKRLGLECVDGCPNARQAAKEVLSLPVHPGVSEDDSVMIANAVKSIVEEIQRGA
jgi:perosamine synthetase